jgi:hypothetical protein
MVYLFNGGYLINWEGVIMQLIGYGLIIVGGISLICGLLRARTIKHVHASHGSVAVGGDSHAPITITTNQNPQNGSQALFWTVWNIVTGAATLLGLALALWPSK